MNQNQTRISTIVQGLVAINVILMEFGITTFADVTADTLYSIVSLVAMVIAWGWGLWKNHNFTIDMVIATMLGRKSKKAKKSGDLTVFDRMRGEL